jgi:zinc transport system ATP-binding protein
MKIVELKNISLKIDGEIILENISLQLNRGEIATLIGPNGGGKTSIARLILEIIKPTNGEIAKEKNLKIGYMPQKIEIDKNIPITARTFICLLNNEKKIDENLASRLGLTKILDKEIHQLSGGQLQRILFLQAVSKNADLLVLDEPTQYMDFSAIQDFYNILDEIRQKKNCAILLISHDLTTVMQRTDFVFCINRHICCNGSAQDINQHPEYISLFGEKTNLTIYQHHHNHQH